MSESLLPPTIRDNVYCVSSDMGGLMPEFSHWTLIWPALRFAPATGAVKRTSARQGSTNVDNKSHCRPTHAKDVKNDERIMAQLNE